MFYKNWKFIIMVSRSQNLLSLAVEVHAYVSFSCKR
jgi:hypothetical protein